MSVIKRRLIHDARTPKGFKIQGIQKSKELAGHVVEDIVLQTTKPDWDRGHHYHNNKTEWFLAVDGSATLTWFDIDGNKERARSTDISGSEVSSWRCKYPQMWRVQVQRIS